MLKKIDLTKVLLYVDDIPIYIPKNSTVMQACEKIGVIPPRFCYHDLLYIAGNCRMCLVEVKNSLKPQVSCGLPIINNIKVYTNTPIVKKSRESVLEFLLLNHPLDCPICDQGGECDLQNQVFKYGSLKGRFSLSKRGVENKGFGPVVKTVITRCIHCTRCVRFAHDIAGAEDLGITIRGRKSEIGLYTSKTFNSEVSSNIVDLCPVGALTHKMQAYKTRPWETGQVKTIDITDNLGSHILVETKAGKAIKVNPRPCFNLNEEWISDKARFVYEGYLVNRIVSSYFWLNNRYHSFYSVNVIKDSIYKYLKTKLKVRLIIGKNLDFETLLTGAYVFKKQGWDYSSENLDTNYQINSSLFQSTVILYDLKNFKSCIILGINPKIESSLVNLRLLKQSKTTNFKTLYIGCFYKWQYLTNNLGFNFYKFKNILIGISENSKYMFTDFVFIYGDLLLKRLDSHSIFIVSTVIQQLKKKYSLDILRLSIGGNSIATSFLGLSYSQNFEDSFYESSLLNYIVGFQDSFIINYKEIYNKNIILESPYKIDLDIKPKFFLSIQTINEKVGTFINFQGLLQKSQNCTRFGQEPLHYLKLKKNIDIFRNQITLRKLFFNSEASFATGLTGYFKSKIKLIPLKTLLDDFYRTDYVTSISITLSKLSSIYIKNFWTFTH